MVKSFREPVNTFPRGQEDISSTRHFSGAMVTWLVKQGQSTVSHRGETQKPAMGEEHGKGNITQHCQPPALGHCVKKNVHN